MIFIYWFAHWSPVIFSAAVTVFKYAQKVRTA